METEIQKLQAAASTARTETLLHTLRAQVAGTKPHKLYRSDGTVYSLHGAMVSRKEREGQSLPAPLCRIR